MVSKQTREVIRRILLYVVLGIGASIFVLPLVWTLSTSLKVPYKVFTFPPEFIPNPVEWSNYPEALTAVPFLIFLRNSLIISSLSILGYAISAALAAFTFARLRFPGRNILFVCVLVTMMLPWSVTFVPWYILFTKLNWIDTFLPLILPCWLSVGYGGGFFIFLLRQFFLTIPQELVDAAKIDGCSNFGIFSRIFLPLSKPVLGIVFIFGFIWTWNDFINPLIFLRSENMFTIAYSLSFFRSMYQSWWNLLMAYTVVAIIPPIALFSFFQKYYIQGIVITGVKE